jgi:hypothetical protein
VNCQNSSFVSCRNSGTVGQGTSAVINRKAVQVARFTCVFWVGDRHFPRCSDDRQFGEYEYGRVHCAIAPGTASE